MTRKQYFLSGLKDGMPICFGYFAVSFAFGIQAAGIGLSVFEASVLSALNVTSAGQFAALAIIASGASLIELAFTQLIINLRYFLMSCALSQKLSPSLPLGHRLGIAYGMTESSPVSAQTTTDDPLELRVATVGRVHPHVEVKIVDIETGEPVGPGVEGEYCTRGYSVMKGYYKMPEATALAIDKDGWLHSGDVASVDENGYFRITGRIKDMIIRGGENIYPKEIEDFLYTNPKVKDVQVIGVPDEQYGEEIMAVVILREGETLTEDELKDYIRSHMAKHKTPRYISFVDAFPMNAAGKILKYKMRENAVEELGLQKASKIVTA